MSEPKKNLCLHGHFYQPPRENPWTDHIEQQDSASPYHDWNERIYFECYLPNTMARVYDAHYGLIIDIVNNFEKISFNIGPSLFWWLEKKHPDTYHRILEADRKSIQEHHGHGNAIAQVYNHMILPLAPRRDQQTQVRWGIEEFRFRFGRMPEALWLPETACNEAVLEILIEEKMRFLILSPHQAQAVRPLRQKEEDKKWLDVSEGQIDPKQPYRCFLKKDSTQFIDIFFYDGPISKDAGFGDVLFDAKKFMDRVDTALTDPHPGGLIHLATDGETYGHHKAFGERALAYALNVEALKRNYHIVNYGEYLEKHPPLFEVRLIEGENGEGTSWSCAHGVKRWKEHCGCRGDGPASWTQHWRKPLREALEWLRDELDELYEEQGNWYFRDVWTVRDAYIRVILNRDENFVYAFLKEHAKTDLSKEDKTQAIKLLEMQRHAMLMFTSCGWFFTEISGIETVQILAYAAKAIGLAHETAEDVSLEQEFLARLAKAKSNIPSFENGKGVYEKLVKPKAVSWQDAVGYHAILTAFDSNAAISGEPLFYGYDLKVLYRREETLGDFSLCFSRVVLKSPVTYEEKNFAFSAAKIGTYDLRCSVKPYAELENAARIESELFEDLQTLSLVEILRKIDSLFGEKYYAIRDLPVEQRKQIVTALTQEVVEKISQDHEALFDQNRKMNEIYRSMNLPVPHELKFIAEFVLGRRLKAEVAAAGEYGFNPKKALAINRIMKDAKAFGVSLNTEGIARFLGSELTLRIKQLDQAQDVAVIQECLNIHKLAAKINAALAEREVQDNLFFLIQKWFVADQSFPEWIRQNQTEFLQLLKDFHISAAKFSVKSQKV